MYMKKICKKCFRQKKELFLLLLLTVIQCKQRYFDIIRCRIHDERTRLTTPRRRRRC
jgi:hypothetical protein